MKIITIAVLSLILVGCSENSSNERGRPENMTRVGYSLETVKHDGHSFIAFDQGSRGGILHHPDCGCLK